MSAAKRAVKASMLTDVTPVACSPTSQATLVLCVPLQGPVFKLLFRHHLVLPGSNSVAVGLSGSTLAGGLTFMSCSLGMTADNVLAATVVLPNGTVVEASQHIHPDLFWVS